MSDSAAKPGAPGRELPAGRIPDFFIVGHAKCGTTALTFMLRHHPAIQMPVKEPRYFAPELRSRLRHGRSRRADSLEGYMGLFAGAQPGQLVGEATPSYLRSTAAAERIARLRPDARIIAIFREPVSFLHSLHRQFLHNYVETEKDFARAIELEPERRRGRRLPWFSQASQMLMYSDAIAYAEQLRRFHAAFGREQVLALIYDDLRADNEATVREAWRFLGVDDAQPVSVLRLPPLRPVRSLHLLQLDRAARVAAANLAAIDAGARGLGRLLPGPLGGALGERWRGLLYREEAPLDERFALELRRRFKGQVEAFSEYLGRDLVSLWGYEDL